MKLLVIEDEQDLLYALKKGLEKKGFAVDTAENGTEGLELWEINEYDLLVLDLNLPILDGLEVLREIRKKDHDLKILILSARGEVEERISGLNAGANDYLVKPFHFSELEARIRALLRRFFVDSGSIHTLGALELDCAGRSVTEYGEKIELTRTELLILEYLLLNQYKTVSAEKIMEHVYDSETDIFSNSVTVHIHSLRKKIKSCTIKTIRGVGYRIETEDMS